MSTIDLPVAIPENGAIPTADGSSPATAEVEPHAVAVAGAEQNSLDKPIDTNRKPCCVCEKDSKYKCPRCSLPFCSVACSTIHKANHPAEEPKATPTPKADEVTQGNGADLRPGTVAAAGFKGPFAALDDSKELRELFKLYPRLPVLLEEINSSTLPPTDTKGGQFGQRRKEEPWNADVGLRRGVEALSKARNSDDKDGQSLREYSTLILQILSGENCETVEEAIQKELATQSAKIIEDLLRRET